MPKRKSLSTATEGPALTKTPIPLPKLDLDDGPEPPPPKRRASQRKVAQLAKASMNPDENANVLDAPQALRASPDADEEDERLNLEEAGMNIDQQLKQEDDSPLSELSDIAEPVIPKKTVSQGQAARNATKDVEAEKRKTAASTARPKKEALPVKEPQFLDPEAEGDEEADEEEIQAALSRSPPVNSDYLPLPWKGRLGYVSPTAPHIAYRLTFPGLSVYISPLLQPTCLQLKDMSYRIYIGESPSA